MVKKNWAETQKKYYKIKSIKWRKIKRQKKKQSFGSNWAQIKDMVFERNWVLYHRKKNFLNVYKTWNFHTFARCSPTECTTILGFVNNQKIHFFSNLEPQEHNLLKKHHNVWSKNWKLNFEGWKQLQNFLVK